MSGLTWVVDPRQHGDDLDAYIGARRIAWATYYGRAVLPPIAPLRDAGFRDKTFATRAEAKEYIEACYALWVAGGEL